MTKTRIGNIVVRTSCDCPPIPTRNFDWSAVDDNAYDGPSSPIGHGPTEQAAVADLLGQLDVEQGGAA